MKILDVLWRFFENNPSDVIVVFLAVIAGVVAGQMYKYTISQLFIAYTGQNKLTIKCAALHNAVSSVVCVLIAYGLIINSLYMDTGKNRIVALCLALLSPMIYDLAHIVLRFAKPELARKLELPKEEKDV